MRTWIGLTLLLAAGCASPGRLQFLEVKQAATCQRFEEFQQAKYGRVEFPCQPQGATAQLTPVTARAEQAK